MPSFGSPFSGFASEHKLTHEELVRAVRFQAVLKDVADEERSHAGQFLKLLYHLAPDEEKLAKKGPKRMIKS